MDQDFAEWIDQWVGRELPSDIVRRLIEEEMAHVQRFTTDFGRFAAQFEAFFSAHVRLLDDINFIDKATWPAHRSVQYVLLAYNAKSLYSAFDRLTRGYYEDSLTLIRGGYETFVRALWVSSYPQVAYNVLIPKPEGRQFNLTNYLRDDLGLQWQTNYSVLSAFAHSNGYLVLEALMRAAQQEGEPERFDTRIVYDAMRIELVGPLLLFVLLGHLRFATDVLVSTITPHDAARFTTASEAVGALGRMVRENPKVAWQRMADDLDWLFGLVSMADGGGDWKQAAAERRT